MFNLIMLYVNWETPGRATIPEVRIFEYTNTKISNQYKQEKTLLLDDLIRLPCLFMQEGRADEIAYVGRINRVHIEGKDIVFEYSLDNEVPPLRNSTIYANREDLDMKDVSEFTRGHWAVKDVDLYRFLLRNNCPRRPRPIVFKIPKHENIDHTLASAMMPFDAKFDTVYKIIQQAAESVDMECRRADDIWVNPEIINDVVGLIDKSHIVICDCTGQNPNVFYEAGIAHTLGREVIFITQSKSDIPFDLGHLQYITYLDNAEGRVALTEKLQSRMKTIRGNYKQ